MKKNNIFFLFKIIFTGLLLIWLVRNNHFSIENIKSGITNVRLFSLFVMIKLIQVSLAAIRMHILLKLNLPKISEIPSLIRIMWATQFVSSVSPISLLGDAFRIKEMMNYDTKLAKDDSLYSSIVVKVLSVLSLVFIGGISGIIISATGYTYNSVIYIFSIFSTLIVLVTLFRKLLIKLIDMTLSFVKSRVCSEFLKERVHNLNEYLRKLLNSPRSFYFALLISLAIQALAVCCFLIIIFSFQENSGVLLSKLASVIPLGIFVSTLPISMSGLGVGQVAFEKILVTCGVMNGSDIFTISFIMTFIFSLSGIIPYIRSLRGSNTYGKVTRKRVSTP